MFLQVFFKRHILLSRSKTTPTSIPGPGQGSGEAESSAPLLSFGAEFHAVIIVSADLGFPYPNGYGTNNLSFKTDTH